MLLANTFMIGMVNSYDINRYENEFRDYFWGMEICMLSNDVEVAKLKNHSLCHNIKYGIHFPLLECNVAIRDVLLLDLNDSIRNDAYNQIENQLKYIKENNLKPTYILFHYPKPVILSDDFDLTNWRFADKKEYIFESNYPKDKLIQYTEELFKWLTKKGYEYNFIPVIEFDGLNRYICKDDFLERLLDKYPNIKVCLDTARLHFQHMVESRFDEFDILKRFSKYAYVIHLSTVQVYNGKVGISHHPVLRELSVDDGWAPIEKYLDVIKQENPNVKIHFEHRAYLISPKKLEECYNWINELWQN